MLFFLKTDYFTLFTPGLEEKDTPLAFDPAKHEFVVPKKEIGPGPDDIPKWEKSEVALYFKFNIAALQ